jgi:hypothetical protein
MWKICPYCEADVEAAPAPTARRTRRRREPTTGESRAATSERPARAATAERAAASKRNVTSERQVASERPVGATGYVDPGSSAGPPTS